MLKEIIDLQQKAVSKLEEQIKQKDNITFKAPTGSGKTYMMAAFMNRILADNKDIVFLVSSLSKGSLANQNYDKFLQYSNNGNFLNIKPYLINTEITGEENLFIPTDYNVYILPRDLYKKNGKLMKGSMENFLNTMIYPPFLGGKYKKIYLIKDECHIATTNLDDISQNYFTKILNFSATPNLKRGQAPDVEISEEDAVYTKLIKQIEFGKEDDTLDVALDKFEEVKDMYRNLLGVNPCLIIQISNKEKADEELNNIIFPALAKHQELKWLLIVNKDSECDTNDVFKSKKLPVSKWKNYAKDNTSMIDVIIFKMVISEGWDIPRACMLYQVRKTQSEILDEQVIGRVRRNPRLLDFENLSNDAQKLATTAWVWGNQKNNTHKSYQVKLFEEPTDITNALQVKTTRLKPLTQKIDFDLNNYIDKLENSEKQNIFELNKKLNKSDDMIKKMCYEFSNSIDKWFKFVDNIDSITTEVNKYVCDYSQSMELVKDENNNPIITSLPTTSFYIDNGNPIKISDWVWKQNSKKSFSFDSEAEWEWANVLKDLSKDNFKQVVCGKNNPKAGVQDISGNIEPLKLNEEIKYLWGKNFVSNSDIKYEYYLDGIHFSFPDFIMVDRYNRVHLFEVKSINKSNNGTGLDIEEYRAKINELRKCYTRASELTNHIFYIPILKEEEWDIIRFMNGDEAHIREETFKNFVKTKPN